MKEITISVDEETFRLACNRASDLETSVETLVREFLLDLADATTDLETPSERTTRKLREAIEENSRNHPNFRMSENIPREDLYDRRLI